MFENDDRFLKQLYIISFLGVLLVIVHSLVLYFVPTPLHTMSPTQAVLMMLTTFGPIACASIGILFAVVMGFRKRWRLCLRAIVCGASLLFLHLSVFYVVTAVTFGSV